MNPEVSCTRPESSLNPPGLSQEPQPSSLYDSPLDQAVVDALRKRERPPSFAEAIHQFLWNVQVHFVVVCHAVDNGDDQGLIRAARFFHKRCSFIGAKVLGNLCLWLEEEGRVGDVTRLVPVRPVLEMEYFRTQMALDIELVSFPSEMEL